MTIIVHSLDDLLNDAIRRILETKSVASPRAMKTYEILSADYLLENPRMRRVFNPVRNWSNALAVGELCWHFSASNDVDALAFYAKKWKEFSQDGRSIIGSCYGRNIFSESEFGPSKWESVKRLLKDDPNTRRAIMNLGQSIQSVSFDDADVSCTNSLQFMIREGYLHLFVTMRSNDIIWGTPYDVFLFTMLQERMAVELGVKLGRYYHHANSLHLYERHFNLAERLVAENHSGGEAMEKMSNVDDIGKFLLFESRHRMEGVNDRELFTQMAPYWRSLALDLLEK